MKSLVLVCRLWEITAAAESELTGTMSNIYGCVSWTGNRTPISGIVHRQSAINNKLAPKPTTKPNPNPHPTPT